MEVEKSNKDFEEVRLQINRIEKIVKDSYSNNQIRVDFYRNVDTLLARYSNSEERVKLNIGGTKFSLTMKSMLMIPDTLFYFLLYNLFSKGFDFTKTIFIDRDPKYFNHIIDLLTLPDYIIPNLNQEELNELSKEIEFYNVYSTRSNQSLSNISNMTRIKKAKVGHTNLDVEQFCFDKFEEEIVVKKGESLEIEFEEDEICKYIFCKGSDGKGASVNISSNGINWTKITKLTKKLSLGERYNLNGATFRFLKISPVDFVLKLNQLNFHK